MVLGFVGGFGVLYVGGLYLIPLAVVVLLWNFSFWFGGISARILVVAMVDCWLRL